jgi:phosphoribosylanthranilate isomerase
MSLALKVCGMLHNTAEVAQLQPDYLGFIFYEKSPRYVSQPNIEELNYNAKGLKAPQNVGVFVNASVNYIIEKSSAFNLNVIQLHGEESVAFIKSLSTAIASATTLQPLKLWKVFSIKDYFN